MSVAATEAVSTLPNVELVKELVERISQTSELKGRISAALGEFDEVILKRFQDLVRAGKLVEARNVYQEAVESALAKVSPDISTMARTVQRMQAIYQDKIAREPSMRTMFGSTVNALNTSLEDLVGRVVKLDVLQMRHNLWCRG